GWPSLADRQPDPEDGTSVRRALDTDVAVVGARDVADQGETDARAADRLQPHGARAIEPLEDVLVLLGVDAGAPVADREHDALALALELQRDLLAVRGVLGGVVDQVHHRERERVGVELYDWEIRLDLDIDRHLGGREPAADEIDGALDD